MNTKTNILPNIIFVLVVIVVPIFIMALASVGGEEELLNILGMK